MMTMSSTTGQAAFPFKSETLDPSELQALVNQAVQEYISNNGLDAMLKSAYDTNLNNIPDSAENLTVQGVCGVAVSAHRLVSLNAAKQLVYAENPTQPRVYGLSVQSGLIGEQVRVVLAGEIEHNGWSWDVSKPLFLGTAGGITQTVPASGVVVVVGYPITATNIVLKIDEPIYL